MPWAVAALGLAAALISIALWAPWRTAPVPTPRKLLVSIGVDASVPVGFGAPAILSPDGTTLAVVAQVTGGLTQLFVRKLDQLQAAPLAGTEGAASPFFSPDGQWIAFFAGAKLKKVLVTGGAPVPLCDAEAGRGGTWTDDDTIIFTPSGTQPVKLLRVSASGGAPAVFGTLGEGAVTQRWPQALPGSKAVLYTEHNAGSGFDSANIVVAPLAGGAPKIVMRGAYYGRYVPSGSDSPTSGLATPKRSEGGHLLYMQQGTLFAVPFSLDRLETAGQAVPAIDGLSANAGIGSATVAFSSDGTLVYVPGSAQSNVNSLDWMTRDGKTSPLRAAKAGWANPRFSPNGQKIAMEITDSKQRDIWVYDWARDTLTQLTFDPGNDRFPVWTPDGKRIVFGSDRAKQGVINLYWVNADGTGEPTRLTDSPNQQQAVSWHPSGKFLAFHENRGASTGLDLMMLPMEGDAVRGWTPGTPTVFLATPATEVLPSFSPDGRWLAYQSNESGAFEIYVRAFPGPGGKWRVSSDGGVWPAWSPASRELVFLNQSKVMVAPYTVEGDSFKADKPQLWSPTGYQSVGGAGFGPYAIHPDGKRLALAAADATGPGTIQDKVVFISNFFDYLNKIAPAKK
jgi:serine/threonine-protein kinase